MSLAFGRKPSASSECQGHGYYYFYHRFKINIFDHVFGIQSDAFGVTLNAKDMVNKILITDLK
jgi:hypothetical protein